MSLSQKEIRDLKAKAQALEPLLSVGKQGLSPAFVESVNAALTHHPLVKIKFVHFKDEKKTLAPELAAKTGSELVQRVGNVAVYHRPKATGS